MRTQRQGTPKGACTGKASLRAGVLLLACLALTPAGGAAQHASLAYTSVRARLEADVSASDEHVASVRRNALRIGGIRPIAVAKWGALAGAAGAAAYGFIRNDEADDLYRELELACNADRAVCALRTSSGAYADARLEAMYQDVVAHDRTSERALIASQVGVALGVVLFLLDLRSDERPADIPYEPRRFQIAPARGGGLTFHARLPFAF
jgi:hypothetical protein